jgi:hypothetical protein
LSPFETDLSPFETLLWTEDFETITPSLLAFYMRDCSDLQSRLEYLLVSGESSGAQLREVFKLSNNVFASKHRGFRQWLNAKRQLQKAQLEGADSREAGGGKGRGEDREDGDEGDRDDDEDRDGSGLREAAMRRLGVLPPAVSEPSHRWHNRGGGGARGPSSPVVPHPNARVPRSTKEQGQGGRQNLPPPRPGLNKY